VARKDKRVLRIHFGLVVAEILCVSGFAFELYRARSGNTLSWAYVFEWPLFGAYAIYMWRRFIRDETRGDTSPHGTSPGASTGEPDAALAAYNEYLRRVHGAGETPVAAPPRKLNR
jgi:hypothetical protein